MGFGLLFLGHLLLFICRGVDIFPDFAAYLLIFAALRKLADFNSGFNRAKHIIVYLLNFSTAQYIVKLSIILMKPDTVPGFLVIISKALTIICSAGMLILYWFLTNGVYLIASEVGRIKIANSAKRNRIITIIYILYILIYDVHLPFVDKINRYLGIFYLALGLAWVILYAVMFYSCYMWICLEGDEDMDESRKDLLNRILSIPEKKEENPKKLPSDPSSQPTIKTVKKNRRKR